MTKLQTIITEIEDLWREEQDEGIKENYERALIILNDIELLKS